MYPSLSPLLKSILKEITLGRTVVCIEEFRNALQSSRGKTRGKRPLGRPRHRWEENIKLYLREGGCDAGNWIDCAQDRGEWWAYVRVAMNLWVP